MVAFPHLRGCSRGLKVHFYGFVPCCVLEETKHVHGYRFYVVAFLRCLSIFNYAHETLKDSEG